MLHSNAGSDFFFFLYQGDFPNCQGDCIGLYQRPEITLFYLSAKALRSRAKGYLSELFLATGPEESDSFFCTSHTSTEIFVPGTNLLSSTATGSDRFAGYMLKRLHCSGIDLLHTFNIPWFLHSFSSM